MSGPFSYRRFNPASWLLGGALLMASFGPVKGEAVRLSDGLMAEALLTINLVMGRDLPADDQAWLRAHWTEEAMQHPEGTVAGLEALALSRKRFEAGLAPLSLVQLRNQIIDETFCAAKRTSDSKAKRLKSILAPDDLVLAADCITGVVVTPFDIKALVSSNILVGEIIDSPVDAAAMEAEILEALPEEFPGIPREQQQRLLWGELRATALEVLWSSVDEATKAGLAIAAEKTFNDYGDVATTAMVFEKTALKKIGDVQVLAQTGDHVLRPAEMATYLDFIAFVTGASLSPVERAEISDVIVNDFREDPEGTIKIAGNLRYWLDNGYHFGEDPANGRIRSWTVEEQARMRAEEAAILFCGYERSGDQRLNDIMFADNPVTEIDCESRRISRASDELLAKSGDVKLSRATLDAFRQAFELIYAFRFSSDERRWFDQVSIADVEQGSTGFAKSIDGFLQHVAEIKEPAHVGPHLNEGTREDLAIRIYCANKDSDLPEDVRMFSIIDAHDPILYEDCERLMILRKSDLDGFVSSFNLIASLGGYAPLAADEIEALPDRFRADYDAYDGGPLRYRSTFRKLSYWWSRMPVEARHRVASSIKQKVAARDDIFGYSWTLAERAGFDLAKLALCKLQDKKLAYETRRVALASRAVINTNPMAASPWVNPEAIDDDASYYGIVAPFAQAQCSDVWN